MAHGITKSDVMVYAGETPWHRLGVKVDSPLTPTAMLAKVAPWTAVEAPLYTDTAEDSEVQVIEGSKAILRSDNHAVLGVVSEDYCPIQPEEFATLLEGFGAVAETGGSLWGGSKIFVGLRVGDPIVVKGDKGNEILPYVLGLNGYDGLTALQIKNTTIRPVCNNTVEMGLNGPGLNVKLHHTKYVKDRLAWASDLLAQISDLGAKFGAAASLLNETPYSERKMRELAYRVAAGDALARAEKSGKLDEVLSASSAKWRPDPGRSLVEQMLSKPKLDIPDELFDAATLEKINVLDGLFARAESGTNGKTAWDALNAVTNYLDHSSVGGNGTADQKRADKTIFGNGAEKRNAIDMILEQTKLEGKVAKIYAAK